MTINLEKIIKKAGLISTGLVLFGGLSLPVMIKKIKTVFELEDRLEQEMLKNHKQDSLINVLETQVDMLRHYQEMDFQFGRLMTDNNDRDHWFVVDNTGEKYNVDVRNNSEKIELAFIDNMFMVYPIYKDHADQDRMYIIIHDHSNNENENYYLYKEE